MTGLCFEDPSTNLFQDSSAAAALTNSHNHADLLGPAYPGEEPKQMLLFRPNNTLRYIKEAGLCQEYDSVWTVSNIIEIHKKSIIWVKILTRVRLLSKNLQQHPKPARGTEKKVSVFIILSFHVE